jgi:hypothetical protein
MQGLDALLCPLLGLKRPQSLGDMETEVRAGQGRPQGKRSMLPNPQTTNHPRFSSLAFVKSCDA